MDQDSDREEIIDREYQKIALGVAAPAQGGFRILPYPGVEQPGSVPQRIRLKEPKSYKVIRGEQLSAILDREVCLDWSGAVELGKQICNQLSESHKQGKPVAQLTPTKIIVDYRNDYPREVRLLCSEKAHSEGELFSYKEAASVLQHDQFLSPEQKRLGQVTPSSDVYTVGALMYACITGSPYQAKFCDEFNFEKRLCQALDPFQVPPDIVSVITRCLHKSPGKRFSDANELLKALHYPANRSVTNKAGKLVSPKAALACVLVLLCGALAISGLLITTSQTPNLQSTRTQHHQAAPIIAFNKPLDEFRFGDLVTITMTPSRDQQKMYLFYIDAQDNVISIYPARDQQSKPTSTSMKISRVGENSMFVNRDNGRFVLVSSNAQNTSKSIIRESDWSDRFPERHSLSISGAQLMQRLENLQAEDPVDFSVAVQESPRSDAASVAQNEY